MHCFPVSDELWEAGKAAAAAQGTTLTAVLREALARYVRRHEKTKEADRG